MLASLLAWGPTPMILFFGHLVSVKLWLLYIGVTKKGSSKGNLYFVHVMQPCYGLNVAGGKKETLTCFVILNG